MTIAATLLLLAVAPPQDALDIAGFFTGRTHADNNLKIAFHSTSKLIVDSVGKRQGAEFVQTDVVREGNKPARTRVWRTHEIAPGHFGGTLTDATGPVDIRVRGNSVVIRYTMNGGLDIEETMTLQTDGKSLANHVVARKFGLTFARVDGVIRKLD